MRPQSLPPSRTFHIGGEREVVRLGFGAMRLTGRGVWGEPADRSAALALLENLPNLGINFIDTADAYGPDVSELLIREALHLYRSDNELRPLTVATKAGLVRTGPGQWHPVGRPEYLIQSAYRSAAKLGVEQIDLWQLHRIDTMVPSDEQFDTIRQLISAGIVRHAGLCQVSILDIETAREFFPVATVQNRYSLADRSSEDVLCYCEENGIGFIPWFPLAGELAALGSPLSAIAEAHAATPAQIALAWLLMRSPVMLPVPGTSSIAHARENAAAAAIILTQEEFLALDVLNRGGASQD
ncbi:aldo/keto reductase [Martelella endophytica]|uniref:Oxidoreductase n=1 Tax=Martelella endophytica TaxID=1486262 RepID=A0A0D5LUZ3_MAREN|nr:aldo/keto reductase [Martelella endophytica]AJY48079.1 oxidoreductase [Martelella endophytica]